MTEDLAMAIWGWGILPAFVVALVVVGRIAWGSDEVDDDASPGEIALGGIMVVVMAAFAAFVWWILAAVGVLAGLGVGVLKATKPPAIRRRDRDRKIREIERELRR